MNLYLAAIKYTNNKLVDIWEYRLVKAFNEDEAEEKVYKHCENEDRYPKKVKILKIIE